MYSYTMFQWLFFFYFYCFFGWCFESAYVSLKSKKPVNRGFMRGPFLPLYGSGAIMMLVVSMPFQDNLLFVYIAGCIGATILEYVTGVAMEALFKIRYWDYSKNRFNFQGHICLGSSLTWGLLTVLMTEVLHKPVEWVVLSIPYQVLAAVTLVLTAFLGADFALSFKAALDLRDVLVKMDKAKQELAKVQKRLEVIIAFTGEDFENWKDDWTDNMNQRKEEWTENIEAKIEDLKNGIAEQLGSIKEAFLSGAGEYPDSLKEEIMDLRLRYSRNVEERDRLGKLKDFFQRDMIRSNPTMSSHRFREALEELQKRSGTKRNKKK